MPRKPRHSIENLTDRALQQFWVHGFYATSMDDLVRTTEVSRHGIYGAYGGKEALFLACFERYRDTVVTPAFAQVEAQGADLKSVAQYFEQQITLAETFGLPGPGCFVANSTTEIAPENAQVRAKVTEHHERLQRGFANALRNSRKPDHVLKETEIDGLAYSMVIFTNGLWSMSRLVDRGDVLRRSATLYLTCLEGQLG